MKAADQTISVIVPIYNVEPYLRQCLDSIVNQTYTNIEVILIDDGSPDNCGAICNEYATNDKRIHVIHKKNGGLAAAKNDGLKAATGKWVTFIDADDWVDTDLFKRVMDAVGHGSLDIVIEGGYYYAYPKKNVLQLNVSEMDLFTEKSDIYSIMTRIRDFGLPWDKFYRIDFLREEGLENDVDCKAFEDYLFNFQAFDKAHQILCVPYCGYYYRQTRNGNAFTHGFNNNKPQYSYGFICKLNEYIHEHGLEGEMTSTARALSLQAINVALDCYYMHPSYNKSRSIKAKELSEMKQWPYFREAIYSNSNKSLSKKQIALKYALRLPWLWPLEILRRAKEILSPR